MSKQKQEAKSFKNTTFRSDYNPTFQEFLSSHFKVFGRKDLADAFKAVTGENVNAKQKEEIKNYKDGDTKPAAEKSANSDSSKSK